MSFIKKRMNYQQCSQQETIGDNLIKLIIQKRHRLLFVAQFLVISIFKYDSSYFSFLVNPILANTMDSSLRILTIGDSTDRLNLRDFCEKFKGNLCDSKTMRHVPSTTHPKSILDLINDSAMASSWRIELCETQKPNMKIAFLFERTCVVHGA